MNKLTAATPAVAVRADCQHAREDGADFSREDGSNADGVEGGGLEVCQVGFRLVRLE